MGASSSKPRAGGAFVLAYDLAALVDDLLHIAPSKNG
jgi:hypothetical protein